MKDQIRLLRDCFHNEIPAVVFQGNDSCAGEILEAAKEIYQKHGCSQEFLYDWQMLINEVKAYQQESPEQVQLPQLTIPKQNLFGKKCSRKAWLTDLSRTLYIQPKNNP